MIDLAFDRGLVCRNGTFAVVSEGDRVLMQVRHYVYTVAGERELKPLFGLVSQPQQSSKNALIIAEKERLNLEQFLPGVAVVATRDSSKSLALNFQVDDRNLEVKV